MRLYVGDDILDFSDDELNDRYIDEGLEAKVYDYGDEVLKIYKDYCPKVRLSHNDALRLSALDTNRVLLPRKIIHNDNGDFIGYTTKRIHGVFKRNVLRKDITDFVDELDLIYDDLKMLSDINYNIADFTMKNVVYDGGLYFVDPGSFMQTRIDDDRFKYSVNTWTLNEFLLNEVFHMVMLTKKQRNSFEDNFDRSDYIGDYIRCDIEEKENVRQYVRRIAKVNQR